MNGATRDQANAFTAKFWLLLLLEVNKRLPPSVMVISFRTGLTEGHTVKRFNQGIYANISSGVIAAIIFVIIALATAWSAGKAVLGALLVGLVTFTVAFLISQTITRLKRRAR